MTLISLSLFKKASVFAVFRETNKKPGFWGIWKSSIRFPKPAGNNSFPGLWIPPESKTFKINSILISAAS